MNNETHQNIILNGVDVGCKDRLGSKFTNEGKWENFIKPLIPRDNIEEMTFIEYGSNCGMFLKLAKDLGFDRVVGIERERSDVRKANEYLKENNIDCKIIRSRMSPEFDFNSLPLADVTLLANFHYHQHVDEFTDLVEKLELKTRYALVVSVDDIFKYPHWRSQPFQDDVKFYFRHWDLIGVINNVSSKDDNHPRAMFSMLFKSRKIDRLSIDKIDQFKYHHTRKLDSQNEFIQDCVSGAGLDKIEKYEFIARTKKMEVGGKEFREYLSRKRDLIVDVKENGMKKAVVLSRFGTLVDGLHRLRVLQGIGKKTVIVRK